MEFVDDELFSRNGAIESCQYVGRPVLYQKQRIMPHSARHSRRVGLLTIRIVGTFDATPASFREEYFSIDFVEACIESVS